MEAKYMRVAIIKITPKIAHIKPDLKSHHISINIKPATTNSKTIK